MKTQDVHNLYDTQYANDYNERYLLNPFSKVSMEVELGELQKLINKDSRWLDLGCGTGYFLSQFKGIERAGLDISPEMLKLAAKENPDALFLKQGDFREKFEEWDSSWSVVSCMWAAYCYVDSMKEFEILMNNMISWTKTDGAIFIPVIDLEDLRANKQVPYAEDESVFGGAINITSATWTWDEGENGKMHKHLLAPHLEHFVKLLSPWFNNIEIVRYPPYKPGWVSRKAVLVKGKRPQKNETEPASVTYQDVPPAFTDTDGSNNYHKSPIQYVSNRNLVAEVVARIRSGSLLRSALKVAIGK